jgi:hypothetical protein
MASSDKPDQTPIQKRVPVSEAEVVLRLMSSDPWFRFDMWSARAWEAAEKASALALSSAPPISSDDVVFDPRVAALFHSAEVAKEFAEMVSPIAAVRGAEFGYEEGADEDSEVLIQMITEPEVED